MKFKKDISTIGEQCTGCGACSAICPLGCIQMKVDAEGFRMPEIDHTVCLNCGKCVKICPAYNDTIPVSYTHLDVYKRQMLGTFVFSGIVCLIRILMEGNSKREWLCLMLSMVCIFLSNSRTGLMCFALALVMSVFAAYWKGSPQIRKRICLLYTSRCV